MGKLVGGKYQLIAHLGGGTVSDVSLAHVEGGAPDAQLAVVKRLKLGADADADLLAQWADEARISQRLKHPNIAEVLAAGDEADGSFLVFEYLEGQTLGRIRGRASRREGGLPRPIALHIVMAIATGLGYAHAAQDDGGMPLQIVHRDVSPENIIVTYSGAAKLFDFSVATSKGASVKGRAGATKGNISYMAPEQGKSAVNLDERADVFATGLVLWELLAGKRMWDGLSEADVLARLADDAPLPSLRSVVPDMPEALDAICARALAKVRDDRFDTAVELKEAIENASKTLGLVATRSEVAVFVTALFEDERDKMRAMVADALASPTDSSHSLPRLPAAESDPSLFIGAAPPAAPVRVVEVVVEQPSRDRRFNLVVGAAVVVAFAAVGVVALTHDNTGGAPKEADRQVAAERPRPAGAFAPAPVVSAYVEPQEITIEITVTPSTAQLIVDGIKIPSSTYRTRVVPGKFTHEVHAEAPGYEPRVVKLSFDRERTFEIALTRKAYVPVPAHRPAAPPVAAASSKPPESPSPAAPPTPAPSKPEAP